MTAPLPFPPRPAPPEHTADRVELELPPAETRPHRYLTLPNGVQAIVVSDPQTDKAAACIRVSVGWMADPNDFPGCAHYCEHLMVKSSQKYPVENEFKTYVQEHGGTRKAETYFAYSRYQFDVTSDALEQGFDRKADLVVNPIFTASLAQRETEAVDNEFKIYLHNDNRRLYSVQMALAGSHPYSKFGVGDRESLWNRPIAQGRNPRDEVEAWWKKQYCPRRTIVAVVGREDLDTLASWVENSFSGMAVATEGLELSGPNGVHLFYDEPYGPEERGIAVFIKPVKDERSLRLNITVPDADHLHEVKPFKVLSGLLGHGGKGSLNVYLKNRGWALDVIAWEDKSVPGFGIVGVMVTLTPRGVEAWRDVVRAIFSYIDLIRTRLDNIVTCFNELSALASIEYRFAEPVRARQYANDLTNQIAQPVPRHLIISSNHLYGAYDEGLMRNALDHLDIARSHVLVMTQKLPVNVGGSFDQSERWFGTEYCRLKLDDGLLTDPRKPSPELALPEPNPYIPTQFDVNDADMHKPILQAPILIAHSELSALWYKPDGRFLLPKTNVHIKMKTPVANSSLRHAVLTMLLVYLIRYEIEEEEYQAGFAGLYVDLELAANTVILSLSGYTDKLSLLAKTVLSKLAGFKVTNETSFKEIVDRLKLDWKNSALDTPNTQAIKQWHPYSIQDGVWTNTELASELDYVTPLDIDEHVPQLLERLHIETLVHGSATRSAALDLDRMVATTLGQPRPLSALERNAIPGTLSLSTGSELVWELQLANEQEPNSVVQYSVFLGPSTDAPTRARARLIAQITAIPTFDYLRTRQQLGYTAKSDFQFDGPETRYTVRIQTPQDPNFVENRIEEYLDVTVLDILEGLSDETFLQHVTAAKDQLLETPKTLKDETNLYWDHITNADYDFNRHEVDAKCLDTITKDDLVAFYKQAVHTSSTTRRKLSIHLRRKSLPRDEAVRLRPATKMVDDYAAFKLGLQSSRVAPVRLESLVDGTHRANGENGAKK